MLLDNKVDEFYEVALDIAGALSRKFFTVAERYTPEDIVQEAACRVVKYNLNFDEERGTSFSTYVYRLVQSVYIDLSRKKENRKMQYIFWSDTVPNGDELLVEETMYDTFDMENEVLGKAICENILESLPNVSTNNRVGVTPLGIRPLSVRSVMELKIGGYTLDEIASFFGVETTNLNYYIRSGKRRIQEEMAALA